MKYLFLLTLLSSLNQIFSQNKIDTVASEKNFIVILDSVNNKYSILPLTESDHKPLTNLLFVKKRFQYYQVLDQKRNMFFISSNWEILNDVKDYYWVCGTVRRTTLKLIESKSKIKVIEQYTDPGDKNSTRKTIDEINKNKVDEILFINGKSEFDYTGNFTYTHEGVTPNLVILKKDGKFRVNGNKTEYDNLHFDTSNFITVTQTGNLYGILNTSEPKYLTIPKFKYFLAEITKQDGSIVFIDIYGNEY